MLLSAGNHGWVFLAVILAGGMAMAVWVVRGGLYEDEALENNVITIAQDLMKSLSGDDTVYQPRASNAEERLR